MKLVLFGTGDIARLAHVYFSTDSKHEVVAFTVDRSSATVNGSAICLWFLSTKLSSDIRRRRTPCSSR
jgi:hypothetical protein